MSPYTGRSSSKSTIFTHVHGPSPDFPALAEVIYLEINSGHADRLCISGMTAPPRGRGQP